MLTSSKVGSYLKLLLLAALAMSYGWGFRGDYGHEAGAMFPGAFLALAILIAAGRADWQQRITVVAMAGAMGWAFGGSMSYGKVIGYTASSSALNVGYGYACLFLIGGLWSAIGAGFLGLALTMKRSWLNSWAGPLSLLIVMWIALDQSGATQWLEENYVKMDVDWVAAVSALALGLVCMSIPSWRSAGSLMTALAAGWCAGFFLLTVGLDLRMTPPRGDNWAGILGLAIALIAWLMVHRNWAALYLLLVGFLAGGYGFALADCLNMMGRAGWGYFGEMATQDKLDSWKWMEQSFGLIMGFGVALGIIRLLKQRLRSPEEDVPAGHIQSVGLIFLLIVMPWLNFFKNIRNLEKRNALLTPLLEWPPVIFYWLISISLAAMLLIAIVQYRQGRLSLVPSKPHGRAQLLLLFLMWTSVLAAFLQAMPSMKNPGTLWVHVTFWITAMFVTAITLLQREPASIPETVDACPSSSDPTWRPRWLWLLFALLVPFVIAALAYGTLAMHDKPLPGSHLRFGK